MAWHPDVVILIDYPGFNFRVAEFAHKAGFKVFYYIAPSVVRIKGTPSRVM